MKMRRLHIVLVAIAMVFTAVAVYLAITAILADDKTEYIPEVPGTDVWFTVIPRPTEERISVTVPISFAFVVNGTADDTDLSPISVENGSLLIPNVRVTETAGTSDYQIETVGEPTMVIRNYSTNVPGDALDDENPPRYGIEVELGAVVKPTASEERGEWEPVKDTPPATIEGHKKYRLVIDGKPFSLEQADGTFAMDGALTIGAPASHLYGWTAGGLSAVPFQQEVAINVEVGGQRSMYQDYESSIKAGQILWSIKPLPLPDDLPELGPGAGQVMAAQSVEQESKEDGNEPENTEPTVPEIDGEGEPSPPSAENAEGAPEDPESSVAETSDAASDGTSSKDTDGEEASTVGDTSQP